MCREQSEDLDQDEAIEKLFLIEWGSEYGPLVYFGGIVNSVTNHNVLQKKYNVFPVLN
jgi:hypothetical protein